MTWTYSTTDLTATSSSGSLAKIRLLVGDTDTSDQQLQDEEIYFAVSAEGGDYAAAALCAELLAAEYARKADKTVGSLSIQWSQRFDHYTALAAKLRRNSSVIALPYAGGVSISDKTTRETDTDRVAPAFYRGLLDNPEVIGNGETT